MPPKGDESPGQTTPVSQTSQNIQTTPGAPIKQKGDRRLKANKEAVGMALTGIMQQIKDNKETAEATVSEELKKKKEAEEDESNAKQLLHEADVNLRRCRSGDSGITAEQLGQAETQYALATEVLEAASKKSIAAKKRAEQAMRDAVLTEQIVAELPQSQPSLPEDTLNVGEDNFNSKYSKYRSYSMDKNPNYPIRSWTLSKEHISFIRKYYITPVSLKAKEASEKINNIVKENADNITNHGDFWFDIPRRRREFQDYCPSLSMPLLRRGYVIRRSFKNSRTRRTACLTAWFLNVLYEYASQDKTVTLREIFYEGKYMFKSPKEAASILGDICALLECTSASVGVIPRQKGTVIGNLKLQMIGDPVPIDCSHASTFIPYDVRKIEDIVLDDTVKYAIVLEKGTMCDRFTQSGFYAVNDCVIVCGYGQPDERTRFFLRKLEEKSSVPIYCLTDPDPYGISIVKTYAKGSDYLSHSNIDLAVVSLHWIGISTVDIQELESAHEVNIFKRCPALNAKEKKILENLKLPQYKLSDLWVERINHMLNLNRKACFEDLIVLGRDYVTEHLVPELISRVNKDIEVHSSNISTLCPKPPKKFEYPLLEHRFNYFGTDCLIHDKDVYSPILGPPMIIKKVSASSVPRSHLLEHVTKASNLIDKNFVAVLGYSTSPNEDEYFLVYEEAPKGSLHDILHVKKQAPLSWNERLTIATSAASGLLFLHAQQPAIVHGAIRNTKVLVFDNFNTKIADFCFSPRSVGSHYDPPDYVLNFPTQKDDVYALGVVLLELLSGKNPANIIENKKLVDWAKLKIKRKDRVCVDPSLESTDSSDIWKFAEIVFQCLGKKHLRPDMLMVHKYLVELLPHQTPAGS